MIALGSVAPAPGQDRTVAARIEEMKIDPLLERVSERIRKFYIELLSVAWTDTVRHEALKEDRTPRKAARAGL